MPRPAVDVSPRYAHPDDSTKQIVVINVPPSVTPIGVKVSGDKSCNERESGGADPGERSKLIFDPLAAAAEGTVPQRAFVTNRRHARLRR